MTTKDVKIEDVLSLIPDKTYLTWCDYNDDLSEHQELLQKCIHNKSTDELYDSGYDWFWEQELDHLEEYRKNLQECIIKSLNVDEDCATELIGEYYDEINDRIYLNRKDDPIEDLIRNTGKLVAHYDTCYEVEGETWTFSDSEITEEVERIKKVLSITENEYDDKIKLMLLQASYGGNLLIYFLLDFNDFTKTSGNSIRFKNAWIGIVDHYCGSGDICQLNGHTFELSYNPLNTFLEETIKYNWTYSIAGMESDWCKRTEYEFINSSAIETKLSSTNLLMQLESKYNMVFASGKCSAGDMDINRHRNVVYINDYPCGSRCMDCGTFWID